MGRWSLGLSLVIAAVFAALMAAYEGNPHRSPWLETIAGKSLDLKFALRGREPIRSKIVIVAGDEKAFEKIGQRPWDHATIFAPMFDVVCGHGVRAFGIDFLWTEKERLIAPLFKQKLLAALASSPGTLDSVMADSNGDRILKEAIAACGRRAVLGYVLQPSGVPPEIFDERFQLVGNPAARNGMGARFAPGVVVASRQGDPKATVPFSFVQSSGLLDTLEVTPPDVPQGFLSNVTDPDGIFRNAILFARVGDFLVPSFGVRLAQRVLSPDDQPATVTFEPHATSVTLATASGPRMIRADVEGRVAVNYYGSVGEYPMVSLADVLAEGENITSVQWNGDDRIVRETTKTDVFKDAIAIYTFTALGANDFRPRPLARLGLGTEIHANLLDNILNNDLLSRPLSEYLAEYVVFALAFSLAFGWLVGRLASLWGFALTMAAVGGLFAFDQLVLFDRQHVFVFGALFEFQLLLQYSAITLVKLMTVEKEKRYIREAFDKFVSPSVINSLLKDPSKLKLGGEKKSLSVLFSDIRGFTTLSEKLDVKTLTLVLNEYLGAMTDILQGNMGTLDKYIGDAVMGFWNAPLDVGAHAELAVKTADEMLIKLKELNAGFQSRYGVQLDIGIGINSGEVSVGNFGSSRVFEYTIIGDNVNLASRLEGVNKMYGTHIIVSESTFEQLPAGKFLGRPVDIVKVKGKEKPVKIYEVFPDTEEHASLKEALPLYRDALAKYYARQWEAAVASFEGVLKVRNEDRVSMTLLERSRAFAQQPPGEDWDGSYELESK